MTSSAQSAEQAADMRPAIDWPRIRRQCVGILRLELRNNLLTRKAMVLYFLALAPVGLMLLWAVSPIPKELSGPIEVSKIYAHIFAGFLRTSVFLSCLIIFMSLFRSEIMERSLHYYFLTPVRREVLVVGKYLAALISTMTVFALSTLLTYVFAFSAWGPGELLRYLFDGPGLGHLITYVGVAMLACVGYGALFQLAGLVFKNPVVPAVLIWAWEGLNLFLPAWLKKISVLFYLDSLYPIPVSKGPFAILTEPTPAWISVPGLLLFTSAVLAVSCWRARRTEITYSGND